jgi:thiamine-monophosphate kinase
MALSEFELIERYFSRTGATRADVHVGIGDDGAVLACPPGHELVAVTDTLVEGAHFPRGSPADSIGHRALAVNLSDIAAMGAVPAWALLALTLPRVEESWLAEFARGFGALARQYEVALIGGDTTAGPLCVTVQVLGFVPAGRALLRGGARPGDALLVSGTPGDAAAGLALEQGRLNVRDPSQAAALRRRFLFPEPRLELGAALRGLASACIDVSDGLLGDLGKLARASGCGATLDIESLPLSSALEAACGETRARELALTGGDDYELLFAVPPDRVEALQRELPPAEWRYARIGAMTALPGVQVRRGGVVIDFSHSGYDHFGA